MTNEPNRTIRGPNDITLEKNDESHGLKQREENTFRNENNLAKENFGDPEDPRNILTIK